MRYKVDMEGLNRFRLVCENSGACFLPPVRFTSLDFIFVFY